MIIGAHVIIYSKDADADRAFLSDILRFGSVDVGGGWLIFGLPPSEVAVHPSENGDQHELYLMCDDVEAFVQAMLAHDISCSPVENQGWGLLTSLVLPGGGKLGVYQPRHERPEPTPAVLKPARKKAPRAGKKKAAKSASVAKAPAKKLTQKPAKSAKMGKKKTAKRKATGGRKPGAR